MKDMSKNELRVQEEIERICKPIFAKVLQEIKPNPTLVGKPQPRTPKFIYFNIHNYRRWFTFSKATFNPPNPSPKTQNLGYYTTNYGSEYIFKNFMSCTIRVKKKTIEITNKIEHKRWHAIDLYNPKRDIMEIIKQKEIECVGVIKAFIAEYGGSSNFKLTNYSQECKVMTSITEDLPKKPTWYTETHKKVYKKKLIEVFDIKHVIQHIENSFIYEYRDEIAYPLHVLAKGMTQLLPEPKPILLTYEELKEKISSEEDAIKYKENIWSLPEAENLLLLKYIFEDLKLFGGK